MSTIQIIAGSNAKNPAGTVPASVESDIKLFKPITQKSITAHNRVVVSPMCMYAAENGSLTDFHLAHYGAWAIRGAGMIIIEATAVVPEGRISPGDSGLWKDDQIEPVKRIVALLKSQGTVPAMQIAHAGRKASTAPPFIGNYTVSEEDGGWPDNVYGASEIKFADHYPQPKPMTVEEIKYSVQTWADAAIRADKAGIEVLEIHSSHGYLLHNFLSGNTNKRTDNYGGSLENRMRFPLEVVKAVRAVWPEHKPLWVRISASDFANPEPMGEDEHGWDIYQSIVFSKELKKLGVDVIDVSSGGNISYAKYPPPSMFQVPFSEAIRTKVGIPTASVGNIRTGKDAESILKEEKADYVVIGREHLRRVTWVTDAGTELGVDVSLPKQYGWAIRRGRRTNTTKTEE
ncbi:hypothetical protein CLU79DRAFT_773318 [Phycomyces nitens]|nr:hypothetical protein CLU79DRAFT_773318 [Phycomyces nitens]